MVQREITKQLLSKTLFCVFVLFYFKVKRETAIERKEKRQQKALRCKYYFFMIISNLIEQQQQHNCREKANGEAV